MSRTRGKRGGTSSFGSAERRRHREKVGRVTSTQLGTLKKVRRKKTRAQSRRLERGDA